MNLQKTLSYIAVGSLFLIPIFPLLVANSFFFPFITGKAFYFRILVELAFSSWIILAFLDTKYRPKFTPLTIGVTLFAVIALVADLLGVAPIRSIWSNFERMEGWLVVAHLWMFYMVAVHMFGAGEEGKRMWHRWLNMSLGVACIITIYALVQLFGGAAIHQGSTRLDASLGNAAYLAVYLLMHIGITMYLFFVARAKQIANAGFLQLAYPILAIIFSFIVLETQTRGTIVGLIGAVLLALALYALCARGATAKKSRIISGSIIGGIILVILMFTSIVYLHRIPLASVKNESPIVRAIMYVDVMSAVSGGPSLIYRVGNFIDKSPILNRIASISLSDTKTQARAYIWPMALKGALERPILGWGQENFNYIFNKDYNPKMWTQEQWFDRAHSVFLDWLVASGFVGLIAYLALYVLALVAIWRSDLKIAQKSVLTGLIAGYAVHNIFVFDNLASYVFFFALLGFTGSLSVSASLKSKKSGVSSGAVLGASSSSKLSLWFEQKTFSKDAVEYIVAPIAIVALVAGIYFLNVRPIQANTQLITALTACSGSAGTADTTLFTKALLVSPIANQEIREQILSCAGNVIGSQYPGPTKQAFFELATKAIQDQIAAAPKDARMYVLGGVFLANVNQATQALPILEKAHELTPGKQMVAIQLASIYINTGKTDEALALLKTAYESDPSYGEAQSAYVTGLIIANKDAEAHRLFGTTTPSLFETDRVARAYLSIKQYDKAIEIYKKLLATDDKNVDLRAQLAQAYYGAGMIWLAVDTMRAIEKDHPEYKAQVEAAIKQIQAPQK